MLVEKITRLELEVVLVVTKCFSSTSRSVYRDREATLRLGGGGGHH